MATQIWVNTGSGNGLEPGGIKPLPETMLPYNLCSLVATWEQLHKKCSWAYPQHMGLEKILLKLHQMLSDSSHKTKAVSIALVFHQNFRYYHLLKPCRVQTVTLLSTHYTEVTKTSQCLKSLSTQLLVQCFVHANNKENIKALQLLALCKGNSIVITMAKATSNAESISMSWYHHDNFHYWSLVMQSLQHGPTLQILRQFHKGFPKFYKLLK